MSQTLKSKKPPKKLRLIDMGLAYRKAKVDLYYSSNRLLQPLVDYERELHQNLSNLLKNINGKNFSWINKDFVGDWFPNPKSIRLKESKKKSTLSYSDPNKLWAHQVNDDTTATFRIMAEPSIDFHVLSALWIAKVGHKYDQKLDDCAYGNRLRRTKSDEFNKYSLGSFTPYFGPYKKWRDTSFKIMDENLENEKSMVVITTDLESFYHELSPSFMLDSGFLEHIGLTLDQEELELTKAFVKALEQWAKITPSKKGLPVGLPASAIVANMALIELDHMVKKELNPLYYGRYVDDIILVMENGPNFQKSTEVWHWIKARSIDFLNYNNDKKIEYTRPYIANSKITFKKEKTKVIILEGKSGKSILESLKSEINERSSEWKLLPNISQNPDKISSELCPVFNVNGEKADGLHKIEIFSLRRQTFALKLRDFEAYNRNLEPKAWIKQRQSFLEAFNEHIVSPYIFFDLSTYLPRVIQIIVSCQEFSLLKNLLNQLSIMIKSVSTCKIDLKSYNEKDFSDEDLIEKWKAHLIAQIEESIQLSFSNCLDKKALDYWNKTFKDAKDVLINPDIIKKIESTYKSFNNCDLASTPLKESILLQNLVKKGRSKLLEKPILPDNIKELLPESILTGFDSLKTLLGNKNFALSSGFLFSTRPLGLSELFISIDDPYLSSNKGEIANAIFALRGFSFIEYTPILKNNLLDVSFERELRPIKIAIVSWETSKQNWEDAVLQKPDTDFKRYNRMVCLLNEIVKNGSDLDYVIFPEVSIPPSWFLHISQKLQNIGVSLICGMEYIHKSEKELKNQVWASLTYDGLGFTSSLVYKQDKQLAAFHEEQKLFKLNKAKLTPDPVDHHPMIIKHGDFYFAMLICSELTNIEYRYNLRGKIDALFVPEHNQDINTFKPLVESAALDIHSYIIQCNDRKFGDSRIRTPYKDNWKKDLVQIKGGLDDYFIVGEIDIEELRYFQSYYRSPNDPYKPTPDGFKMSLNRKRSIRKLSK